MTRNDKKSKNWLRVQATDGVSIEYGHNNDALLLITVAIELISSRGQEGSVSGFQVR